MTRTVVPLASLARELGAAPALIKRLVRAGLVVPLGRDRSRRIWVDVDARRQIERVLELIAAGYAERDIAVVIGRIERGPRAESEDVCDAEGLAKLAGVSLAVVQRWVAGSRTAPWAVIEGGDSLFAVASNDEVRVFAALDELGLGEHAHAWLAGSADEKAAAFSAVRARLDEVESAARVLRKLLPKSAPPRRMLLGRMGRSATKPKLPTKPDRSG